MTTRKPVTTLVPYFGGNRTLGPAVGAALAGLRWVGVPFAGGMAELPHVTARTVLVNDLHRHVVNLARVVADPGLRPVLLRRLRRRLLHPDELAAAQRAAAAWVPSPAPDLAAAEAYFVACWMGRSGKAGTVEEFAGGVAARWTATGGDSAVRYVSALRAVALYGRVFARCSFETVDAFEFIDRVGDEPGHGLYCDPPWPDDGGAYRHGFDDAQQRRLAAELMRFGRARVVVRYGDHPLVRELYPAAAWRWVRLAGRTGANKAKAEVLLTRG